MDTHQALINLNVALIAEGVPEEERLARVAVLRDCIEYAELTVRQIKKPKQPAKKVFLSTTVEVGLFAFFFGWMAGIMTLDYIRANQ